eukprot:6199935-Pleurochrysis_carterae.AAC.4
MLVLQRAKPGEAPGEAAKRHLHGRRALRVRLAPQSPPCRNGNEHERTGSGDHSCSAVNCLQPLDGLETQPVEKAVSLVQGNEDAPPVRAVESPRPVALPLGVLHEQQLSRAKVTPLAAPGFGTHIPVETGDQLPPRRVVPVKVVFAPSPPEPDALAWYHLRRVSDATLAGEWEAYLAPVRLLPVVIESHHAPGRRRLDVGRNFLHSTGAGTHSQTAADGTL